jgi:uncharacterized membrane protein YhaH (DUF805 family)
MGGLGEFFGFDGRINRLGYLWRCVVVGASLTGLTVLGSVALATFRPGGMGDFGVWTQRLTMAVMLIGLWAGFGLTTRRLRDMGLEPAHVVPAYAALWVVNTELLQPMARLEPQTYGAGEAAWIVLQVVCAILLLGWPSRPFNEAQQRFHASANPASYLDWRESN